MSTARFVGAIRPADMDDVAALASLATQLGYPSDTTAMRRRLMHVRERQAGQVFVAIDTMSRVVGFTHVVERFTLDNEPFCEIAALVVDETIRSAGVGAALLRTAESWAHERGFNRMRVRSNVIRQRAHEFYKREGYVEKKRQVTFEKSLSRD